MTLPASADAQTRPEGLPTEDLEVPEPPGSAAPSAGAAEPRDDVTEPLVRVEPPSTSEAPPLRIPSRVTTRIRALDGNLQTLAARSGDVVNAVLSMITGGLSVLLGALRSPNDDAMSIYLYAYGGIAALRGGLSLALAPNAQGPAIAYQHMPMTTVAEVRERLAFGERALASIAEQSLIARVLDGSLNMATGVAVVPILFADRDLGSLQPFDYFVVVGAGVSVVSGIITLATPTSAEQRWASYRALRDRLQRERREELQSGETAEPREPGPAGETSEDERALLDAPPRAASALRLGASPTATGFFTTLSGTF